MSAFAGSIDNDLLTSATIEVRDEAVDLDFKRLPLFESCESVHGKGLPKSEGGHTDVITYEVGDHSPGATEEITGYERVSLTVRGTGETAALTPFATRYPLLVSQKEIDLTSGPGKIVGLAERRVKKTVPQAMRDAHRHLFRGGVAGYSQCYHLNGDDDNVRGVLESDAPGAQSNPYFGFSKTSFALAPGAQNQAFNFGGSFNANGWVGLVRMDIAASELMANPGARRWYLSLRGYEYLLRILQPQYQYQMAPGSASDKTEIVRGMKGMLINGAETCMTSDLPNAGTATTAAPWTAVCLDHEAIYFKWLKATRDGYFGLVPWENLSNGLSGRIAEIFVGGQLNVEAWAGSAVGVNGDTW